MTRTQSTDPVTMPAIRHVDVPDYPAAHSRRCRSAPSPPAHRPIAAAGPPTASTRYDAEGIGRGPEPRAQYAGGYRVTR